MAANAAVAIMASVPTVKSVVGGRRVAGQPRPSTSIARRGLVVRCGAEKEKGSGPFSLLEEWLGGRGLGAGEASLKTDEGITQLFGDKPGEYKYQSPEKKGLYKNPDGLNFDPDGSGAGGWPGGETALKEYMANLQVELAKEKADKKRKELLSPAPKRALPLLLPGMTAIVTNPKNSYFNFTGIVQRVTDNAVGVLFEGGNWDKMITFRLDEVEKASAPPMVNPKSAVLEERARIISAASPKEEAPAAPAPAE